jgi:transcriptional regulator with XRE-family HTH domain
MKPNEIRAQLVLKGITQHSIAEKAGVSDQMVSMVINGYRNGKQALIIKKIIAEVLDKDIDEVFNSAA